MTPERLDPLTSAVRLYKQGDAQTAEAQVKKYLMSHPDDIRAWLTLAKMTEDVQVKRRSLERVLAKDPYHKQARDMLNVLLDVMPSITEFGTEARVNTIESKKRATLEMKNQEEGASRLETVLVFGLLAVSAVIVVVVAIAIMQGNIA